MFHWQKNPSMGTAQQRLFLVLEVVFHAVVVISEVLRLSTKSRWSRCCRAHLYSQAMCKRVVGNHLEYPNRRTRLQCFCLSSLHFGVHLKILGGLSNIHSPQNFQVPSRWEGIAHSFLPNRSTALCCGLQPSHLTHVKFHFHICLLGGIPGNAYLK